MDLEEVHLDPLIPYCEAKELDNAVATVALPALLFEICTLFLTEKTKNINQILPEI